MNEKSPHPLPLPPPESFYVFVVGHCEEWPENRHDEGDTAIYNEYLDFGVPPDQCVYIKDDDCTRENCQQTLEAFLERITPSSSSSSPPQERPNENTNSNPGETLAIPKTLVFFYGGHGVANGFSTIGGTWSHRQIAQTIEASFHGDRVLFLLDCCASGNLWRHIPSPSSPTKKTTQKHYVLLGTSHPYLVHSFEDGDDEWILSHTWIQLMRHLCATGGGSEDYLGLENMISLESDRHMFQEASLLFAYIAKPSSCAPNSTMSGDAWSWMPAGCRRHEQSNKTSSNSVASVPEWLPSPDSKSVSDNLKEMPDEAKILSVFDCRVGGAIVYKHPGGYPKSLPAYGSTLSSSIAKPEESLPFYVPPLWLNGTIVSIFENRSDYSDVLLRIRVWYPSQNEPWEVELSHRSPRLINHLYVTFNWMLPSKFLETQVMLAKNYRQYLDCSMVANTPVRVALGNADDADAITFSEGTILDWKDFHWKHLLRACTETSWITTKYDDFDWNELPVPAKAAAEALGYTKSSWDKDTGIPADNMEWEELSTVQKDAASFLGYRRKKPEVSPSVDSNGWKSLAEISTCSGPHVPVEWENNQSSLVPLKQIVVPRTGSKNTDLSIHGNSITEPESSNTAEISDDETRLDYLRRQSLIRGLKSSGKSIANARSLLGTAELTAFWVDDETWWDAVPIDIPCQDESAICGHKELSLDLLATHFEYTLPGVYCPVEYADGEKHLIPLNYIFRRGCQPEQEEEETGTEDAAKLKSEKRGTEDVDADPGLENTVVVETCETETRTQDAIQVLEQELLHL